MYFLERKRSEEYLVINLAVERTLSDFLASYLFPHLLTKQASKRSSV